MLLKLFKSCLLHVLNFGDLMVVAESISVLVAKG